MRWEADRELKGLADVVEERRPGAVLARPEVQPLASKPARAGVFCASLAAWTGQPARVPAHTPARAGQRSLQVRNAGEWWGGERERAAACWPARSFARAPVTWHLPARSQNCCPTIATVYYMLLHYYYHINTPLLWSFFAITTAILQIDFSLLCIATKLLPFDYYTLPLDYYTITT